MTEPRSGASAHDDLPCPECQGADGHSLECETGRKAIQARCYRPPAAKMIYLSGPISLDGRATPPEIEANVGRFHAAKAALAARGFTVLSPLDNGLPADSSWADHMRADLAMLLQADELVLLPRWQESRGSTLEMFVATQIGIPVSKAAIHAL